MVFAFIFIVMEIHFEFKVTEQEVVRGILLAENNTESTLAFFREIQNINVKLFQHSAKFIDINFAAKNVDEEAQKMLSDLRDVKVSRFVLSKLSNRTICKFSLNLTLRTYLKK